MSFKKALTVYRKELLELFRDRRTLFTTIILPMILYPLIFIGYSALMIRQTGVLEQKGALIAVTDSVNDQYSQTIIRHLIEIENFQYKEHGEQSKELYEDKVIDGIITIRDSTLSPGVNAYLISVQYDQATDKGRMLIEKVRQAFSAAEKEVISGLLLDKGVSDKLLESVIVKEIDTSTEQKRMGMILGMILPYLMIMLLITSAAVVAADLVAGEKERKTLETLLVSAVARNEIVMGKYLTIITFAFINVIINLFSLFFSMRYMLSMSGIQTEGVRIPLEGFGILLLALIPLATLFASILLSISTFSRHMKEARSYEQPLLMITILLAMISFFPAIEMNKLLALIPVVNISLLFKAVMINDYQLSHLLLTIGSTIVYDILAIWMTIRLFKTEAVLFRVDDDSSIKNIRKVKQSLFNPYYGLVYFTLSLLALFYLGRHFQSGDNLLKGLMQTQILIILLPVLLLIRLLKLKPKEILRIKMPRPKELVLLPFITIPATLIVAYIMQLVDLVFPIPAEYYEMMKKIIKISPNPWILFLSIAVLPGICEEVLFRGWLMRFYEHGGKVMAVVYTAMFFAIFHMDPFRLLPTFFLGLLLGYLTIRSGSIVNSILSHTINNGFAIFAASYAGSRVMQTLFADSEHINHWILPPAVIIFAVSLILFHKATAPKENLCAE